MVNVQTIHWIELIIASTVVSAFVTGYITLRIKSLEYKNEYYKKVIDKRLNAYSLLETHISLMKYTVLDPDGTSFPGGSVAGNSGQVKSIGLAN